MKLNEFYNENCFDTLTKMKEDGMKIDIVLTSPPYNMTKRKGGNADSGRYDVYKNDFLSEEDYLKFSCNLFNELDKVVKKNGVVLYNFSYSVENPNLPYVLVSELAKNTAWTLADTIIWKKTNAMPYPAQERKLVRIWEFVWVFVRKSEVKTFTCNKGVASVSEKTGQKYYNVFHNFVEAKNNDGATKSLNQATYSTELCTKLLSIYGAEGYTIYDPFMGTGTTANACKKLNMNYIGSEISAAQCEYSKKRLAND